MKKLFSLFLLTALAFIFIGCSKNETTSLNTTKDSGYDTSVTENNKTIELKNGYIEVGVNEKMYTDIKLTDIKDDEVIVTVDNPSIVDVKLNGERIEFTGLEDGSTYVNVSSNGINKKIYVKSFDNTEVDYTKLVDFPVKVTTMDDFKVLFLADTQIIDYDILYGTKDEFSLDVIKDQCFRYIEYAYKAVEPDLVILTGDNIYGRFDPTGKWLTALYDYIESFGVTWSFVYGNHDNECTLGVNWQNELAKKYEHCLFKESTLPGNTNYSIGIIRNGAIERTFYLMDSNGCLAGLGMYQDQIDWMVSKQKKINSAYSEMIASSLVMHIPSTEYLQANAMYSPNTYTDYEIGVDKEKLSDTDMGWKGGINFQAAVSLESYLKQMGADTVFCGHEHLINTSIKYNGIIYTFCLKSSEFDAHNVNKLGGTMATISSLGEISIEHKVYEWPYDERLDLIDENNDVIDLPLYSRMEQTELENDEGIYFLSNPKEGETHYQVGPYIDYLDLAQNKGYKYLSMKFYIDDISDFLFYIVIGFRHYNITSNKITATSTQWQRDYMRLPQDSCRIYDESGNLVMDYMTYTATNNADTYFTGSKRGPLEAHKWYTVVFNVESKYEQYVPSETIISVPNKMKIKDVKFTKTSELAK